MAKALSSGVHFFFFPLLTDIALLRMSNETPENFLNIYSSQFEALFCFLRLSMLHSNFCMEVLGYCGTEYA